MNLFKKYPVVWFVILTVALSFATYFLPLPAEQKSLLVPVLMVLIPDHCKHSDGTAYRREEMASARCCQRPACDAAGSNGC